MFCCTSTRSAFRSCFVQRVRTALSETVYKELALVDRVAYLWRRLPPLPPTQQSDDVSVSTHAWWTVLPGWLDCLSTYSAATDRLSSTSSILTTPRLSFLRHPPALPPPKTRKGLSGRDLEGALLGLGGCFYLFVIVIYICYFVCGCTLHGSWVEARGHLVRASSLFPPCGLWESSSGHQAGWKCLFPLSPLARHGAVLVAVDCLE